MAIRIKLKVIYEDKELEVISLVNSGFETETPQLLLPVALAKKLTLWPPVNAQEHVYDTAGGPTRMGLSGKP